MLRTKPSEHLYCTLEHRMLCLKVCYHASLLLVTSLHEVGSLLPHFHSLKERDQGRYGKNLCLPSAKTGGHYCPSWHCGNVTATCKLQCESHNQELKDRPQGGKNSIQISNFFQIQNRELSSHILEERVHKEVRGMDRTLLIKPIPTQELHGTCTWFLKEYKMV